MVDLREKILKKWKLNTDFDKYDLAYKYIVNFFNLVKIGKINFFGEENSEYFFIKDINNWKVNTLLKKLNILKKEYLILCNQNITLKEISTNNFDHVQDAIDEHFEFLSNLLILAREKLEYIMDIQFKFFDKFVYSVFLLVNVCNIKKVLWPIIEKSFRFPNVDFQEQYEASLKPALKQMNRWKNKKNFNEDLNKIIRNFIFHCELFYLWEDFIVKKNNIQNDSKTNNTFFIQLKNTYRLFLIWICLKLIIPLHIAVENDIYNKNYKNLIEELYTGNNFDEILNIFCKKIEILIGNKNIKDKNAEKLTFFIKMWKEDNRIINQVTETNLLN